MYSWSTRAHPIGEYIGSLEVTDTSQGLAEFCHGKKTPVSLHHGPGGRPGDAVLKARVQNSGVSGASQYPLSGLTLQPMTVSSEAETPPPYSLLGG
jgi:hypothetical protein